MACQIQGNVLLVLLHHSEDLSVEMARSILAILALAAASVGIAHGAYCHGAPHPGKFPNLNPISLNNGGAVVSLPVSC